MNEIEYQNLDAKLDAMAITDPIGAAYEALSPALDCVWHIDYVCGLSDESWEGVADFDEEYPLFKTELKNFLKEFYNSVERIITDLRRFQKLFSGDIEKVASSANFNAAVVGNYRGRSFIELASSACNRMEYDLLELEYGPRLGAVDFSFWEELTLSGKSVLRRIGSLKRKRENNKSQIDRGLLGIELNKECERCQQKQNGNSEKLFSSLPIPENTNLRDLWCELQKQRKSGLKEAEIARLFHATKGESLLKALRTQVRRGKIRGWKE